MIIFPVFAGLCHSLECYLNKKKNLKKPTNKPVNFLLIFNGSVKRWGGKGSMPGGFLTGSVILMLKICHFTGL